MRRPFRRRLAIVAGLVPWLAPTLARAGTDPIPAVDSVPPPPDVGWFAIPLFALVAVAVVVAVTKRRPTLHGAAAAVAILIATGLVATVMILVAFFSDFSGRHQVAWPVLILAIAVLGLGGVGARRAARR